MAGFIKTPVLQLTRKREGRHLINGDYTHLWVAFFEIDADFLATVTQSNASRLVAREVELLQPALL